MIFASPHHMIAIGFTKTGSPGFMLAAHFNCHSHSKQVLAGLITDKTVPVMIPNRTFLSTG
jgi:hypothetical protein